MDTRVLGGILVLIAVAVSQPITDGQGVMPGLFISADTLKQLQEQGRVSSSANGNQGRNVNPDAKVTSNLDSENQEKITPNSIASGNGQPIMSNQQPSLSYQQPAYNNQQPTATNPQPTASQPLYVSQPSSNNNQPTYFTQPTTSNNQQPIYIASQPASNQPILVRQPQPNGNQPIYLTQQPGVPNQQQILVNPQPNGQQTFLVNQQPPSSNQPTILVNQQPSLSNQQPTLSGQPAYILKNAELASSSSGSPTLVAVSTGNQPPTQTATIYAVVPINNQNAVAGAVPTVTNGNTYVVQGQPNQVFTAVNSG